MRWRDFLGLLGRAASVAPSARPAHAQTKIPRLGYFWSGFRDPNVAVAGLRQGLQKRGYVLGDNLLVEERYAEGDPQRTRALIAALLALEVDVLVTGDWALIEVHALTDKVPDQAAMPLDLDGDTKALGLLPPDDVGRPGICFFQSHWGDNCVPEYRRQGRFKVARRWAGHSSAFPTR